jgi:hypothetical protein
MDETDIFDKRREYTRCEWRCGQMKRHDRLYIVKRAVLMTLGLYGKTNEFKKELGYIFTVADEHSWVLAQSLLPIGL